jgi:hypothetical protein
MQLEQIPLYSHVRSGNLHGIVTNIDLESDELTICQLLYGKVHQVSLKDFVRKYRRLQVCEYYLPKRSEDQILQRIQELAIRIDSTDTDPYLSRDRLDCLYCIYGDLTRWRSLECLIPAIGLMLVITFLGDMSILTHQTVGYLQALVLIITVLDLVILIYRPCKIIEVDLGATLKRSIPASMRDLSIGCHIVLRMGIGAQHHGIVYIIDSHDLDGIYVAHNTKNVLNARCWGGMSSNIVVITTLREFLADHKDLQLVEYPCEKSADTRVMVGRIVEVVDSSENHQDLLRNNCEAFVLYCKYGWLDQQLPHQIKRYCHPHMFFLVLFVVTTPPLIYKFVVSWEIPALLLIAPCASMAIFLQREIFGGPAEHAYVKTPITIEGPETEHAYVETPITIDGPEAEEQMRLVV